MKRNTKKILSFLLAVMLILPVLAGCAGPNDGTTQGAEGTDKAPDAVKLWYGYNTENFMQDLEYPDEMNSRDYTLRMHGVRGDVETIQLMITPTVNIVSYDLVMNDLKNENGDVFSAENLNVYAEWYVEVLASYNLDSYFGFYPDAVVPLENFKMLHHNSIDANENQGLLVEAKIPLDAAPGKYTGTAVLDLDGTKYNVPIELTVYDAQMPEQLQMETLFSIWWDYIAYGEGSYDSDLAEAYYWFLVDKKIMPGTVRPSVFNNYETYTQYIIDNFYDNPKISSYSLPYNYDIEAEYEDGRMVVQSKLEELLTVMALANIELRKTDPDADIFKKANFYLGSVIDEPSGANGIARVRECDRRIAAAKKNVADKYLTEYPDLYYSMMDIRHIVTTPYNKELLGGDELGGVQCWCPQFQHWHTEQQRQEYWDRQETPDRFTGEHAWWYGCNNPKAPFPTYHLDDDNIGARVLSWMQFDYNVEGNLYWLVNNYKGIDNWTEVPTFESAGEGSLVYPGVKYGIYGPISTLRLEVIREGIEDYECMMQIQMYVEQYNEANGTDHDARELMKPYFEDLYNGVVPARGEHELMMERRIEWLKVLEALATDLDAGMEMLLEGI